ncbi:MAG TPA: DinB family protein [Candidatus Limnocylindria bacterium]|nr:DinB family protein [Candidatus Limnocylindria bacterium]
MTFVRTLARLASLTDLDAAWTWREGGETLDRRDALFRILEAEQDAAARGARPDSEPAAICALAQEAFGDLAALLGGLDESALDAVPAPGEWSVRATLAHTIAVERSYLANTKHALVRGPDEPLTLPAGRRPAPIPSDTEGDGTRIAERLAAYRAETDTALGTLDADALARPTQWSGHTVDVRFRLHRFASHLVEHTVQCEKALDATAPPSEARRIARRIGRARGSHERASGPAALARLDAGIAEILGRL